MIGHMAKAHRENPHHLARITLRMADTIKTKLLPCHEIDVPPPKYKMFESRQGGIVIHGNEGKRGRSRDWPQR
jgi:hypothetical protein